MIKDKKEKFARFGIATKGVVYCLIGILASLTYFNLSGEKTGTTGVIQYLSEKPFGQILLVLTAVGLIGYVFWRFYQTFFDSDDLGNDLQGIATRVGFFTSILFYSLLAFSAISILFGISSSSGNGNETIVAELLSKPYGQLLVGIVGCVFLGKSIFQFFLAFSGNFKKKISNANLSEKQLKLVLYAGRIGYTARGLVIAGVSWLTFESAMSANSNAAGGTEDAFNLLQHEFGGLIFVAISLGLFAYGFFLLLKSKFRVLNID